MLLWRPLLWAVLLGGAAAFAARREGRLPAPRDPSWRAKAWRTVGLEGVVAGSVRRTGRGWRTVLDVPAPSGVQRAVLWLPKGPPPPGCEPGRRIAAFGRLRPTRPARDPGDYDEEAAEAGRGAAWVLEAGRVEVSSAPPAARFWPQVWAQRARLAAEAAFERRLVPYRAALLAALAFGEGGGLGRATSAAVRDAGGMHLLVAGAQGVWFAAAAGALAAFLLGLRPLGRGACALAAAAFYALMVGADPPSVRAWLMLGAASAARALDRPSSMSAALTLAAAALLAVQPAAALSLGALLSFGGVAAILAASSRLDALVPSRWPRLPRHAAILLGVGAAMTAVLWPLLAATFLRVSMIGPLANLALIPLAGLLLYAACVLAALDAWAPAAAAWAARAADAGLALFERICLRAASVPGAAVSAPAWGGADYAGYALVLAAFLAWPRRRLAAGLTAAAVVAWALAPRLAPPPPVCAVFLSRPPGAALLRFSGGRAWFVGPRPPDAAARRAALALGAGPVARVLVGRRLVVRLGVVSLRLGDPAGPAARRGEGPFAIIGRPRAGALEAATDGSSLVVRVLRPGLFRGPGVPQRVQAGLAGDAGARARPAQGARDQSLDRERTPPR
ncbi:MAG: ComEC/Rec2 family competence protein [Elusimicrobia bacterium]|nr:ComEC/Rec2 family competence protein [Elusimicrobiota bacterium]